MTTSARSRRSARSTPERGTKAPLKTPPAAPSGTSAAPFLPADGEGTREIGAPVPARDRQDADSRYRAAAILALGEDGGRSLAADPVWGSVVRRLFDAEGGGWDPALATVTFKRELASADSLAEVLAWRIDTFLDGNPGCPQPVDMSGKPVLPGGDPVPSPACHAYESTADAREHLTAVAVSILGRQLSDRAQNEIAWPALIAALRRAENADFSPADALTCNSGPRTSTSQHREPRSPP